MKLLPARFRLRLVGRVEQDAGWLDDLLGDPDINAKVDLIGRLPVERVVSEIDRCDILLQPASSQIVAFRYASPLKSYDYMVRGKPIIAADVPSHREILEDGVNARFYRHDDAGHLAACIRSLAEQQRQAESLAKAAWEQAVDYNYDARARRILALIDSFRG
jgi:glycosyltransferase involved in cell wall biosynthesis